MTATAKPGGQPAVPDAQLGELLTERARTYQATLAEHERARAALHEVALAAWRAHWRPATISEHTGMTTSYLRKLARDAGLPAAPTGRRPRAARSV